MWFIEAVVAYSWRQEPKTISVRSSSSTQEIMCRVYLKGKCLTVQKQNNKTSPKFAAPENRKALKPTQTKAAMRTKNAHQQNNAETTRHIPDEPPIC